MLKLIAILLVSLPSLLWAQCGQTALSIEEVQGDDDASPWVGKRVTIEAVVTAAYQSKSELSGFFVQGDDTNATQSHGLFVFSRKAVDVGERLRISGRVKEFHQLTELVEVDIESRCGVEKVPAPAKLSWSMNQNDLEALESVRVILPESTLIDQFSFLQFGQLTLAQHRPIISEHDYLSVLVDDASSSRFPSYIPYATELASMEMLRLGNRFKPITGVLSFSFGEYRILPDEPIRLAYINVRPNASEKLPGTVRLVSANVENLFNGDGLKGGFPTERGAKDYLSYQRQLTKVVAGLSALQSDLYVITELENDGFDSGSSISDLTTALTKARPNTNFATVFFSYEQLGKDAIRNGIIYDQTRLMALGESRSIATDLVQQWPNRLHRPSLLQRFRDIKSGKEFSVVANHFKSKGSGCEQDTEASVARFGACNAEREEAATLVLRWLQRVSLANEPVFLMGDLNSYNHEPPIEILTSTGFKNSLNKDGGYSYVFKGKGGQLDYILMNERARDLSLKSGYWHINADELPFLDYRIETKSKLPWLVWQGLGPERFSDHDPVFVDLEF